jgi:hypothetical protein
MSIAAGIAFIVLGAILTFALKGGHIGDLDLHAVGVILMLAGVIGILLPILIRNRSRFSRATIRSRQDVMDDGTRTIVNHTDGSQTLVEHNDGEQTFAEHIDAGPSLKDGRRTHPLTRTSRQVYDLIGVIQRIALDALSQRHLRRVLRNHRDYDHPIVQHPFVFDVRVSEERHHDPVRAPGRGDAVCTPGQW